MKSRLLSLSISIAVIILSSMVLSGAQRITEHQNNEQIIAERGRFMSRQVILVHKADISRSGRIESLRSCHAAGDVGDIILSFTPGYAPEHCDFMLTLKALERTGQYGDKDMILWSYYGITWDQIEKGQQGFSSADWNTGRYGRIEVPPSTAFLGIKVIFKPTAVMPGQKFDLTGNLDWM